MFDKIKEKSNLYKDTVIGNTVYDLLKYLFGVALSSTVLSTISSIVIDIFQVDILQNHKVPIFLILIFASAFIGIRMFVKKIKHIPDYPTLESDYDIVKRVTDFTYGRDKSIYKTSVRVKSNINNLNRVHGKYTWSGSDTPSLRCTTKHCNLIPLARKDSFIEYEIELKKNYKKGKEAECTVVGEMPDSQHTFIPFFSTRVTEVTKLLVINICIPPEYNVTEVLCEIIAIDRNANQTSEEIKLDGDGKYTWTIHNPKLFYVYSIRWGLSG